MTARRPLVAGLLGAVLGIGRAWAKASKGAVRYQGSPNGGARCGLCLYFADGACRLVDGAIDAHGWCQLYRAKP